MRAHANLFKNKTVVLATFVGAALIIFSPSTGRIFLSDDYCTLNNIVNNKSVWLETFFRPIGDATLMWNYKLAGWDPFYFYLTNILLHAFNSFLLYMFCLRWYGQGSRYVLFGVAAGVIFLTYPSHAEAIFWAIGRGISLAVTFSLLAMIVVAGNTGSTLKYLFAAVLYFLALACYESVLLLPVVLTYVHLRANPRGWMRMAAVLAATLVAHLALRYYVTGGMWRAYNGVIFSKDIVEYFSSLIKIIFRMFIPAFNHPLSFGLCGVLATIVLAVIISKSRKRFDRDAVFNKTLMLVLFGLLSTIVVTISFGVSTRTSEGDRFMYLPSVFYCVLLALITVRLVRTIRMSLVIVAVLVMVQSAFVITSQRHWVRASDMAVKVINGIAGNPQRPLFLVNLPSDYSGAYVFRNCLPEALLHYGIDTAGIRVANIIQSAEIGKKQAVIVPEQKGSSVFIWPGTLLEMKNDLVHSIKVGSDPGMLIDVPAKGILYWNKEDMVPLMK